MSFSHVLSPSEKTARVNADGAVDVMACIAAMQTLADDDAFKPDYTVVVDLRRVEYVPDTSELFVLRSALVGLKQQFQGEITLLVSPSVLYMAQLVCLLTDAWGLRMKAIAAPISTNTPGG